MLQTETVLVVGGHPPIPGILISFYPASTRNKKTKKSNGSVAQPFKG